MNPGSRERLASLKPAELLQRAAKLAPAIAATTAAVLTNFIKRDEIVRAVWLALVSDSAAFFLGAPGVAKTATVQELARLIDGCKFFEALMPAIVSPDQLFVESTSIEERQLADGAKSISVKQTLGRAAKAHVFFADEIWKAEPAVLQPLLDLARADGVRHEGAFVDTPIMAFLAASNELAEEGSKLGAMWSRMIIRVDVRGLDAAGRRAMVESRLRQARGQVAASNGQHQLSVEDVELLQAARPHVELPNEIVEIVLTVIDELAKKDAQAFGWLAEDDRRFGFVMDVLQSAAILAGRTTVAKTDLAILEYMLWNEPSQIGTIRSVLAPHIRTPAGEAKEAIDALLAAGGTVEVAFKGDDPSKITAALRQCKELKEQTLPGLRAQAAGTEAADIDTRITALSTFIGKLAQKIAGVDVGTWEDAIKGLS